LKGYQTQTSQLLCARARGPSLELAFFTASPTSTNGSRNFTFQLQGFKRQIAPGKYLTGCGISGEGHTFPEKSLPLCLSFSSKVCTPIRPTSAKSAWHLPGYSL